jgi:hypothetical protein
MDNAEILKIQQRTVTDTAGRGYKETAPSVEHNGGVYNGKDIHKRKNTFDAAGYIDERCYEKNVKKNLNVCKKDVISDAVE